MVATYHSPRLNWFPRLQASLPGIGQRAPLRCLQWDLATVVGGQIPAARGFLNEHLLGSISFPRAYQPRDYWLKGILLAPLTIISAYILVALSLAWVIINNADPAVSVLLEPDPLDSTLFELLFIPFGLVLTWMYLAISAKRWHDIGKSAWWNILIFVPIVGTLVLFPLIIGLGLLPGKKEDNEHGATLRKP